MADTLEDFYARLGASVGPSNDRVIDVEYTVSGDLGATNTVDATVAMSKVVTQYVALSAQGETLRQMLTVGVKVPCDVWAAYAGARQDYLTKGQYLFNQLTAKGVTVEQVVYSGGKPQLDPQDPTKVRTLQVAAPLRPPAFVGINQQCPSVPVMSGAMGWEPIPVSLASASSSILPDMSTIGNALVLLSSGNFMGLAGYGSYKVGKQIAAMWEDFDASPSRILVAYTGCFQAAVKGGMSPAAAAQSCQAVQVSAQNAAVARAKANNPDTSLGFWGWLGVGAGVVILGSIVLRFVRSRVGTAARLISPIGGCPQAPQALDGVSLGELYFRPKGRRRGRR